MTLSLDELISQSRGAQLFADTDEFLKYCVLTHVAFVEGVDTLRPRVIQRLLLSELPLLVRTSRLRSLFAAQQGYPGVPPEGGFGTEPEIWAAWVARSEREKQERIRLAGLQQGSIDDTANQSQGSGPGVEGAGVPTQK
jgi:hypothetical protein